ncbi:MAG: hypothetical protein AAB681_03205 [Patescibacteria group bacterium]
MNTRIVIIYDDLSTDHLDPLKRLFNDTFEEVVVRQTPLQTAEEFLRESGEFNYCFYQEGIEKEKIIKIINNSNTEIVKGVTLEDKEVKKLFSIKDVDKKMGK